MDTRVLVAVLLSLLVVFAYQELVLKRLYPPTPQQAVRLPVPLPTASLAAVAPSRAAVSETTAAVAHDISIVTDTYEATITSRGGRLKSLRLKAFKATAAPNSGLLEMVERAADGQLPLGIAYSRDGTMIDDRSLDYRSDSPPRIEIHGKQSASVTLEARTDEGLTLTKRLTFQGGGYLFDLEAALGGADKGITASGLVLSHGLNAQHGYYDLPELQAYIGGKTYNDAEKTLRKGLTPIAGKVTYAGFGDRYFLSVYLPKSPEEGTLTASLDGHEATAFILFPGMGANSLKLSSAVYMGPKELGLLESANSELSHAIDFGWTGILALAFLRALKLFHQIAPNWGVDIILLTIAIRVVFLPMSIRSQRSMMRLQRLQPQVERMREKFKDDKERLNREMIDLYKRNHVNPLGGCAPMLLQLPIFIGLYEALLNAVELRHAPFVGWIRDLSAPECLPVPFLPALPFMPCGGIPVLVLLMGLSTFLQQYMSPQAADPNQQRMMMFMPLVMTVMFINFPAGLSLYYFSSNVLGIIQQLFLNREFKQLSPANA